MLPRIQLSHTSRRSFLYLTGVLLILLTSILYGYSSANVAVIVEPPPAPTGPSPAPTGPSPAPTGPPPAPTGPPPEPVIIPESPPAPSTVAATTGSLVSGAIGNLFQFNPISLGDRLRIIREAKIAEREAKKAGKTDTEPVIILYPTPSPGVVYGPQVQGPSPPPSVSPGIFSLSTNPIEILKAPQTISGLEKASKDAPKVISSVNESTPIRTEKTSVWNGVMYFFGAVTVFGLTWYVLDGFNEWLNPESDSSLSPDVQGISVRQLRRRRQRQREAEERLAAAQAEFEQQSGDWRQGFKVAEEPDPSRQLRFQRLREAEVEQKAADWRQGFDVAEPARERHYPNLSWLRAEEERPRTARPPAASLGSFIDPDLPLLAQLPRQLERERQAQAFESELEEASLGAAMSLFLKFAFFILAPVVVLVWLANQINQRITQIAEGANVRQATLYLFVAAIIAILVPVLYLLKLYGILVARFVLVMLVLTGSLLILKYTYLQKIKETLQLFAFKADDGTNLFLAKGTDTDSIRTTPTISEALQFRRISMTGKPNEYQLEAWKRKNPTQELEIDDLQGYLTPDPTVAGGIRLSKERVTVQINPTLDLGYTIRFDDTTYVTLSKTAPYVRRLPLNPLDFNSQTLYLFDATGKAAVSDLIINQKPGTQPITLDAWLRNPLTSLTNYALTVQPNNFTFNPAELPTATETDRLLAPVRAYKGKVKSLRGTGYWDVPSSAAVIGGDYYLVQRFFTSSTPDFSFEPQSSGFFKILVTLQNKKLYAYAKDNGFIYFRPSNGDDFKIQPIQSGDLTSYTIQHVPTGSYLQSKVGSIYVGAYIGLGSLNLEEPTKNYFILAGNK